MESVPWRQLPPVLVVFVPLAKRAMAVRKVSGCSKDQIVENLRTWLLYKRVDIRAHVPRFAKRSWLAFPALHGAYKHVQLRIEFRPESFDGIILLSGERDDLTGDFMALLLNKGFVEFWFDCGSGVGSVRSRETILLNEWNSVIIYRHRWDAWLVLNHGTKVQGRSNVSSLFRGRTTFYK